MMCARALNMQKPKRSKKGPGMRMDQLVTVRLPSETMRALERWATSGQTAALKAEYMTAPERFGDSHSSCTAGAVHT